MYSGQENIACMIYLATYIHTGHHPFYIRKNCFFFLNNFFLNSAAELEQFSVPYAGSKLRMCRITHSPPLHQQWMIRVNICLPSNHDLKSEGHSLLSQAQKKFQELSTFLLL